ncbi:MAG: sensor histidine kinase [Bacteroidetes bacterium]|nr:sensor histidine kinase [Bacteroidota bacterium]
MNDKPDLKLDEETAYRFEHFFELSPDLLCIAGYDGFFKKINSSVSKLLGYTDEELFSRPIDEFVHIEDRSKTSRAREGLKKNNPLLHFENRYVTKSGEIVWLSWTSMPIDSEQLVFAIAKNITHNKKLEDERNLLLANLTKSNKDLKQRSYTASHDLRSPVNNLLSILSLLDVSKINDGETLTLLELLKSASVRLSQTINDQIDSIIQKDNINVPVEELEMMDCLQTVLRSVHSLVEHSRAIINIDFSELEKIIFNRTYLESIFLNLITNSIKYTQPGHAPVLSIYSKITNGKNQLIISDNGMGLNMNEVKDKLFGLHQTFHEHSDSKGVGLYLVYNHVTGLGGTIAVESAVNEGTTFTISFKN